MFGLFDIFELVPLIAGGILLLCLLPFVAGPIVIYFTIKQPARPEPIPFVPGQAALPPHIDKYFSDVCWALDAEGFQLVTGMFPPRPTENVIPSLVFVVNRDERVSAIIVALHAQGMTPFTQMHVEFVTRFRDGCLIQTSNAEQLTAFPIPENVFNAFLLTVKDPRRLFRVHRARVRLHSGGGKVLRLDDDFAGDAVRYMQFAMVEELEHAARAGYMRLDENAGVYRPTIKGACLMTWGELWPIKAVRRFRRARREKQLLEELALQMPELIGIGK